MDTVTYLCTGCQLRCQLVVTVIDHLVQSVQGNRCQRGRDLAHQRIKATAGELTLRLRVSGGAASQVEARASQPVTPDVARAIALAVRALRLPAPVHAGDCVVSNAANLKVDLIALSDIAAAPAHPRRKAAARTARP